MQGERATPRARTHPTSPGRQQLGGQVTKPRPFRGHLTKIDAGSVLLDACIVIANVRWHRDRVASCCGRESRGRCRCYSRHLWLDLRFLSLAPTTVTLTHHPQSVIATRAEQRIGRRQVAGYTSPTLHPRTRHNTVMTRQSRVRVALRGQGLATPIAARRSRDFTRSGTASTRKGLKQERLWLN